MQVYFTSVGEWLSESFVSSQVLKELNGDNNTLDIVRFQQRGLNAFLSSLREELIIIVETNYTDPVYSDSYKNLYVNKLKSYPKHCVRLSFFEPFCVSKDEFLQQPTSEVQERYLGFLVVRPLYNCVGRNAIDVRAKKEPWGGVLMCKATIKSTCIGHKLWVRAFPHASQDAEHMSCAENSIWALLEYFGNKYAIYDPILPSEILSTLKDYKHDRLVPTSGLNYNQISILLKKRGFETKIYSYKDPDFQEIFSCYIESGLPLVTCIQGSKFGHAVVCIGRTDDLEIQNGDFEQVEIKDNIRNLCYWNRKVNTFVVNDDNFPSYKIINFQAPASEYEQGKDAQITSFIVPLHEEIYLPAELAISTTNVWIDLFGIDNCCIRTFLTTSRSYRRYIVNNNSFSLENKQILLQVDMPKFVWISEYFGIESVQEGVAEGVFIMDATSNTRSGLLYNALIVAIHHGNITMIDRTSGNYVTDKSSTFPQNFERFIGNLK